MHLRPHKYRTKFISISYSGGRQSTWIVESVLGGELTIYLSATTVPLRVLAECDFSLGDDKSDDMHACDSGSCFV